MSVMQPIGKSTRPRGDVRPRRDAVARVTPRVHPSWLDTPPAPGRIDAPTLRRLWDAVDGD